LFLYLYIIFYLLYYIYNILLFSRNPDAGQYLSFASIRCSMHRERMKSRSSVPDTLASLYNILKNSDIMQNVCKEKVITDGKTAIILSTNYLL